MAEPQPSAIKEGAAEAHAPTGTAEDRKAAAALQSLDAQDEPGEVKEVDSKALGDAMKGLIIGSATVAESKSGKIRTEDVVKLVAELELSKQKATEILRAHEGDAVKAMIAFVNAPA